LSGQIENARAENSPGLVDRQAVTRMLGEQGMETLEGPGLPKCWKRRTSSGGKKAVLN